MRFISTIFSFFVLIFLSISLVNATEQGLKADMNCEICGMGIMKGGKGNFVIELKDGSARITDSPDCAVCS